MLFDDGSRAALLALVGGSRSKARVRFLLAREGPFSSEALDIRHEILGPYRAAGWVEDEAGHHGGPRGQEVVEPRESSASWGACAPSQGGL